MIEHFNLDFTIRKLGIENPEKLVQEAACLGLEYIKFCGSCNKFTLCAYLGVFPEHDIYRVDLLGLAVSVDSKEVVNGRVLALLKYSSVVVGGTSAVVFYVTKEYSMGVLSLLCKEGGVHWEESYSPVDYEEVRSFVD